MSESELMVLFTFENEVPSVLELHTDWAILKFSQPEIAIQAIQTKNGICKGSFKLNIKPFEKALPILDLTTNMSQLGKRTNE